MEVTLISAMPLYNAVVAARECWDSLHKTDCCRDPETGEITPGPNDLDLIKRLIRSGHESVLEHVVFTFRIDKFSRALLQELSRHRIASPSVQSSRYTLKKLITSGKDVSEFVARTGNDRVDGLVLETMRGLRKIVLTDNIPNDILKYAIPEAYLTREILTINARSLRNLIRLRTSPKALLEFSALARALFEAVAPGYGILFFDLEI